MNRTYLRYIAECLGTFLLTSIVMLGLADKLPLSTPVSAGLILGFCVYIFGSISGAHLNPAITLGLFAVKKISPMDTIGYIVAQVLGALLALQVAIGGGTPLASIPEVTSGVFIAEAFGAFILAMGVIAVVYKRVTTGVSGIVIGSALLLGISFAASMSLGILNPAVAIGLKAFSAPYIIAPLVGALIAVFLYRFISGEDYDR